MYLRLINIAMVAIVISLLSLAFAQAYAGDRNTINTTNNYYTTEVSEISTITHKSDVNTLIAMGVAGDQCHHDWGTDRLQACVGVGRYRDESAAALGLGKRFGDSLVSGSIQTAFDGNPAYGAGLNWRF